MASATLPFFPAFSSVYSTYLSMALSKGQGSFFIQPMKAMHRQKDLLHQEIIRMSKTKHTWENLGLKFGMSVCMCICMYFSLCVGH